MKRWSWTLAASVLLLSLSGGCARGVPEAAVPPCPSVARYSFLEGQALTGFGICEGRYFYTTTDRAGSGAAEDGYPVRAVDPMTGEIVDIAGGYHRAASMLSAQLHAMLPQACFEWQDCYDDTNGGLAARLMQVNYIQNEISYWPLELTDDAEVVALDAMTPACFAMLFRNEDEELCRYSNVLVYDAECHSGEAVIKRRQGDMPNSNEVVTLCCSDEYIFLLCRSRVLVQDPSTGYYRAEFRYNVEAYTPDGTPVAVLPHIEELTEQRDETNRLRSVQMFCTGDILWFYYEKSNLIEDSGRLSYGTPEHCTVGGYRWSGEELKRIDALPTMVDWSMVNARQTYFDAERFPYACFYSHAEELLYLLDVCTQEVFRLRLLPGHPENCEFVMAPDGTLVVSWQSDAGSGPVIHHSFFRAEALLRCMQPYQGENRTA